jgi:threonine synthase
LTYHSTRGQAPILKFDDVLLSGLARDGGLYLPTQWPRFSASEIKAMAGLDYAEIALRVMLPFLDGTIDEADFAALVSDAYGGFSHRAVAPMVQLGANDWLLELFHGPTLAFKDFALQLVGRLFDHVLAKRGERITIIGATSGDTGSAAIEACRDRAAVDIVILHPFGRTSEVQRRQMTSVMATNVFNIAIDGSFDDCQDLVKAMFNDQNFRDSCRLSAVNSINWARILGQVVYYFVAAIALGAPERGVAFSVPTGNFGNVYAGLAARHCGLPIHQLVIGSNRNDILTRFFASGRMQSEAVMPTLSPSMDIQISSNFERYLFDLYKGDAAKVVAQLSSFRQSGSYAVEDRQWAEARALIDAKALNDGETLAIMRQIYQETGQLIDPHSAIGVAAGRARRRDPSVPMVALATAHPAKFPDAVERATGKRPSLPAALADLYQRPERFDRLPNDLTLVKDYVNAVAGGAR